MANDKQLGAVLKRHVAALRSSPRTKRWARERLKDLDSVDGAVVNVFATIGIGLFFAVTGYAIEAGQLRELLRELAAEPTSAEVPPAGPPPVGAP